VAGGGAAGNPDGAFAGVVSSGQAMTSEIDFYWDTGSTNTYFAMRLMKPIAARWGFRVVPHPFNLGYVFRKNNYVLMDEPREKLAYRRADLMRWARRYGLPFRMPTVFPIKTSRTLRGALAMRRFGKEWAYMEALFTSYWERDDHSIADYPGLKRLAESLGVDPNVFEQIAESAEVRAELVRETDEGLARGVFGAPTYAVGNEMFWGKDRLDFLEEELERRATQRS
jgi:2-hydroxychromene-2-carboxylate isomerase